MATLGLFYHRLLGHRSSLGLAATTAGGVLNACEFSNIILWLCTDELGVQRAVRATSSSMITDYINTGEIMSGDPRLSEISNVYWALLVRLYVGIRIARYRAYLISSTNAVR